jgi:hypothetical protein
MDAIRDAIYRVTAVDRPMTVRQVFYRLVSEHVIGKTEAEYKRTVCRLLAEMRRSGEIPFDWIADSTRWMRKPDTYTGLAAMLEESAALYRRDLWAGQHAYVEIWLEKEALAGVLYETTAEWGVPLMVTRGYPSISFLHAAAAALTAEHKPVYLYYFGDRDPSGVDIQRAVEDGIREFAPEADFTVEPVAVTALQVENWELPTRPTKRSDTRSKGWKGGSVELDAILPRDLRQMAREVIECHVDHGELARLRRVEAEERRTLEAIAANWNGAPE